MVNVLTSSLIISSGMLLSLLADAPEAVKWQTAKGLERQLDLPTGATWENAPLRDTLQGFFASQRVAWVGDRRVDPGRLMTFNLQGRPLRVEIKAVADHLKLGVTMVGPVVYLGPAATVHRLAGAAQLRTDEVNKLPAAMKAKWLAMRPASWDELATPRELLQQTAQAMQCELKDVERVPHDLWAAASLPDLTAVERLTLVAGQFDLTFTIESGGQVVRLVPLPAEVPLATTLLDAESARTARPDSFNQKIDKLTVVNKPLNLVLDALTRQLGLIVRQDDEAIEAAKIDMKQLVSFEVKNASIDQTLQALLQPAGLSHRRTGPVIAIYPTRR